MFGGSPSLNRGRGDVYRSVLSRIGGDYGDMYNQANSRYQGNQAQADRATTALSDYLTSDQATNPYNAEQTAKYEQGASEGAAAAQANLSQELASRGMGPSSSAAVGGAASINAAQLANHANVQARIAQENEARHQGNLETNANLLSGVANTDYGRATGALDNQAGINSGLMSEEDELSMDEYNQKVAQQNAQAQFWASLGSAGINAFATSKKPASA